jgi:hypothetical protein
MIHWFIQIQNTLVHLNTKYIGSLIHCTRAVHKKKKERNPHMGIRAGVSTGPGQRHEEGRKQGGNKEPHRNFKWGAGAELRHQRSEDTGSARTESSGAPWSLGGGSLSEKLRAAWWDAWARHDELQHLS